MKLVSVLASCVSAGLFLWAMNYKKKKMDEFQPEVKKFNERMANLPATFEEARARKEADAQLSNPKAVQT